MADNTRGHFSPKNGNEKQNKAIVWIKRPSLTPNLDWIMQWLKKKILFLFRVFFAKVKGLFEKKNKWKAEKIL